MAYGILPTKEFGKDFRKIKDKKAIRAIINKVEEVAENPERYKRLHYDLSGSFRVRVMNYRVIYSIDRKKKLMYLEKMVFGHKYKGK